MIILSEKNHNVFPIYIKARANCYATSGMRIDITDWSMGYPTVIHKIVVVKKSQA